MARITVWDLPTRLFHWMLGAGFVAAAVIALVLGEDGGMFAYHAIIGLTIALMVCMRVIWGVVGTRWARFGSFVFGPGAVMEYSRGVLLGGGKRYIGHNPGSSLAIFAMLAMVLGLGVTGVMLSRGNEGAKEVHEVLAWAMVVVVIAHVAGVLLHTVRHRENITASMIHGKKVGEAAESISSVRPMVAVVFLAVTAVWAVGLIRNYDATTQTTKVPLLSMELKLGENEGGERDHDRD